MTGNEQRPSVKTEGKGRDGGKLLAKGSGLGGLSGSGRGGEGRDETQSAVIQPSEAPTATAAIPASHPVRDEVSYFPLRIEKGRSKGRARGLVRPACDSNPTVAKLGHARPGYPAGRHQKDRIHDAGDTGGPRYFRYARLHPL